MTAPTIAHARKMQLEAAAEIEATGWDERGGRAGVGGLFRGGIFNEAEGS